MKAFVNGYQHRGNFSKNKNHLPSPYMTNQAAIVNIRRQSLKPLPIPRKSKNLHANFVDLNADYNKMKYKKPKVLADHWINQLTAKLKEKIQIKEDEMFEKFVKEGGRLEIP